MARWSLPIDKYVRATRGNLEQAARAVAFDMFSRIIVRSPVDTGRFRGNWQIDVHIVPAGWAEQYDKGGQGSIDRGRINLTKFRLGNTISMRNNVPYSIALEHGHSGQAPQGMVKVTMVEFGAITAAAARRIRNGGKA